MDASYANDCVEHQCGAKLTPERMMEASISSPRLLLPLCEGFAT